ncbi:Uncharacterised protein [Mycolicibacterium vanbaalenii]|uniref:Uncharacterized protein n=2 Tax=Mycolicibacterium vanbaalenii TaxID=110539 RepID=A0A5S9R9W9_MYCVN|nr:Uncharacterised protein [Mycolicibacterium vanbaalenii]
MERAEKRVDWAAVEARRRDEAARATVERIKTLRRSVFHNVARGRRDVAALRNEPDAAELLVAASNSAHDFMVLAILQKAIANRWDQVVRAGIGYFGDHPVADRIQELWNLTHTTDRTTV